MKPVPLSVPIIVAINKIDKPEADIVSDNLLLLMNEAAGICHICIKSSA